MIHACVSPLTKCDGSTMITFVDLTRAVINSLVNVCVLISAFTLGCYPNLPESNRHVPGSGFIILEFRTTA